MAVRLLAAAREIGPQGLIHVAADERRAEKIASILRRLAQGEPLEVAVFPPWDCLPYDHASPSRESMGRRMSLLARLAAASDARAHVVVTSPEAVTQRVPPRQVSAEASYRVGVGDGADLERLRDFDAATGYLAAERVDDAGQIDIRAQVIDIFPAAADAPLRLDLDGDRITAIRVFDPATQLTTGACDEAVIGPASEVVFPVDGTNDPVFANEARTAGLEHGLARIYSELDTLFDYLPAAVLSLDPGAEVRRISITEQVRDAHEARQAMA